MLSLPKFIVANLLLVGFANATNHTSADTQFSNCGGPIEADSGRLTYPNPDDASNRPESGDLCIWTIHLKTRSTFRLSFSNLDIIGNSENCKDGALRVYSLTNLIPTGGAESYTFCNTQPPTGGSFFVSENLIAVIYRTSHNSSGSGFTLNWEGISIQPIVKTHESTFTTASSALIKYPVEGGYPPNHILTWQVNSQPEVISGPTAPTLHIKFPSVQTEPCGRGEEKDCLCDALVVYQVTNDGQLEESRYCGNVTDEEILEASPNFILAIFSDNDDAPQQKTGFEVTYTTIQKPPIVNISKTCGEILSGASGIIEYKLNQTYEKNERCIWTIRTDKRTQITLTLYKLGIENWYDALEVLAIDMRGNTTHFPLGQEDIGFPKVIDATVAIISFYTDRITVGTGFSLSYQAGGEIENDLQYYRDINIIQSVTEPGNVLKHNENEDRLRNGELSSFVIQHATSEEYPYEPMTLNITALNLERDQETGKCQDMIRVFRLHSRPNTDTNIQEIRPIPDNGYNGLCQMDQVLSEPFMKTDYVIIIFLLTNNENRSDGFQVEWDIDFDK